MNAIGRMFIGAHVRLYRATNGKIGSSMMGGHMLLLTTTGSKTGKERTVPVMYFEHEGKRFVIASNNGAPIHPAWFNNLKAKPEVGVQVRERKYTAHAEAISGDERAKVWKHVVATMPRFGEYEKKAAGREIPVVQLRE